MPLSLPCVCAEQAGSKIDKKLPLQTDEHDYSGKKQEGVESPWELLGWSFSCIFGVFVELLLWALQRVQYLSTKYLPCVSYRSKVPKVCMFKFKEILTYLLHVACCVYLVCVIYPGHVVAPREKFAIRGSCDNLEGR